MGDYWLIAAVGLYTLYSVVGISSFLGTNPDKDRSFSWIGTADEGNIGRNMQFAAYISVHGVLGSVVYALLLGCKQHVSRATLPALIFAFQYATGSIGVRTDHLPHNVCAGIAFGANLLAAVFALCVRKPKYAIIVRNLAGSQLVGFGWVAASFSLLIAFASGGPDVCEWIALYIMAFLPAYIWWQSTHMAVTLPDIEWKQKTTYVNAFYVLGTLLGCFAAAWELHHIELRYDDKKNCEASGALTCGRQNWGSALTLAMYKLFIFTHVYEAFKEQENTQHKWLHYIPVVVTTASFVLWTAATGMAMRYDGQSYAHVLGTTLGGLLLPALVVNTALLWPSKKPAVELDNRQDSFRAIPNPIAPTRLATLTF